jgi:hypothetical protein
MQVTVQADVCLVAGDVWRKGREQDISQLIYLSLLTLIVHKDPSPFSKVTPLIPLFQVHDRGECLC